MSQRRSLLLQMKRTAGLATPTELAELDSAYKIIGEGLAVPLMPLSLDDWLARSEVLEISSYCDPPAKRTAEPSLSEVTAHRHDSRVTSADDGLVMCSPENEPSPANKPRTYRPNVLGRG